MYLTKEGTLTESVSSVYLSKDEKYYHRNMSIVKLYEDFNIKDFDKLVPSSYFYKGNEFHYPEINAFDKEITYTYKDDSDIYVSFHIDSNFNKDTISLSTPSFSMFDRTSELFVDLSIFDFENGYY